MSANNESASLRAESERGEGEETAREEGDAAEQSVDPDADVEGLTHAELSARVLNMSKETRNVEEPLGTAQWPTGQLSNSESKLLADAIRRRRRRAA